METTGGARWYTQYNAGVLLKSVLIRFNENYALLIQNFAGDTISYGIKGQDVELNQMMTQMR